MDFIYTFCQPTVWTSSCSSCLLNTQSALQVGAPRSTCGGSSIAMCKVHWSQAQYGMGVLRCPAASDISYKILQHLVAIVHSSRFRQFCWQYSSIWKYLESAGTMTGGSYSCAFHWVVFWEGPLNWIESLPVKSRVSKYMKIVKIRMDESVCVAIIGTGYGPCHLFLDLAVVRGKMRQTYIHTCVDL